MFIKVTPVGSDQILVNSDAITEIHSVEVSLNGDNHPASKIFLNTGITPFVFVVETIEELLSLSEEHPYQVSQPSNKPSNGHDPYEFRSV